MPRPARRERGGFGVPPENLRPTSLHPAAARRTLTSLPGCWRARCRHFRALVCALTSLPGRCRVRVPHPTPGAPLPGSRDRRPRDTGLCRFRPSPESQARAGPARRWETYRAEEMSGRREDRREALGALGSRREDPEAPTTRRGTVADGGHAACRRSLRVIRARRAGKRAGRGGAREGGAYGVSQRSKPARAFTSRPLERPSGRTRD